MSHGNGADPYSEEAGAQMQATADGVSATTLARNPTEPPSGSIEEMKHVSVGALRITEQSHAGLATVRLTGEERIVAALQQQWGVVYSQNHSEGGLERGGLVYTNGMIDPGWTHKFKSTQSCSLSPISRIASGMPGAFARVGLGDPASVMAGWYPPSESEWTHRVAHWHIHADQKSGRPSLPSKLDLRAFIHYTHGVFNNDGVRTAYAGCGLRYMLIVTFDRIFAVYIPKETFDKLEFRSGGLPSEVLLKTLNDLLKEPDPQRFAPISTEDIEQLAKHGITLFCRWLWGSAPFRRVYAIPQFATYTSGEKDPWFADDRQ